MTNPNPGTNSLPFGVDKGCDELGVVCVFPAVGAGAVVSVLVFFSVVAVSVVAVASNWAVGICNSWTVAFGTTSAVEANGFIGLTGDIGLAMFIGFVKDFTQLFLVSAQAPKIG